jgi:hypothetical protein
LIQKNQNLFLFWRSFRSKNLCQWIEKFHSLIGHSPSGFDFFTPHSPSTQADFAVQNYFFRTAALHFWDFLVKNHPIVQFKTELIQFLPTTQKPPFK